MASFRNLQPDKTSVYERVHLLSQKINAIPLTKSSDTAKRYELMDRTCDELESQLQELGSFIDEKLIDIKHITSKISKQIKRDHNSIDTMIRQEIANSNERMMLLIQQQHETRKQSDLRIMGYIQQQSNFIREALEQESVKRQDEGQSIKLSLEADINEITRALDQISAQCSNKLQKTQIQFSNRTDAISANLRQICAAYSDNQSQFYKMLRDLVKKVKQQLSDHQRKREQTEAQILNLIQKMCDRAISQKNI